MLPVPSHDAPSQRGLFVSMVHELARGLADDSAPPEIVKARERLLPFVCAMKPDYVPAWYHAAIAEEMELWWNTPGARTILNVPPQHGKTELASRALPAWILGRSPDTKIIAGSYADGLAAQNNIDVQSYIDSPAYADVFPGTKLAATLSEGQKRWWGKMPRRTSNLFEVVGRRGGLRSVGVGAGISGHGAEVLVIDDPFKGRKEAESETIREGVWRWFANDIKPRLKPPGKILVIMTRWHEDDLVGRLLANMEADPHADRWRVVRFPAIAETLAEYPRHHRDLRPDGAALWEARYPLEALAGFRADQTGYEWDGLYQQRPTRPGGLVFQRDWFRYVDELPPITNGVLSCRFWDVAASDDDPNACWTVGARLHLYPDGRVFIDDIVRGQWSPEGVDRVIEGTARSDGYRIMVREEREPGSSGKAVVVARGRTLAGFDYKGVPSDQKKELRWRALAARCEAGAVYIVANPKRPPLWVKPFLDEMEKAGPGAKLKDQPDAASGAFLEMAQRPRAVQVAQRLGGF